MAKPKQNDIRKSIFLTKELSQRIEKEAKENGTNFSNWVRMILIKRYKQIDNE